MKFTVNHDSRIGRRSMNQDRVGTAFTDQALLLVVCDGMGGHKHGEIAAKIVVEHLLHAFAQRANPRLDDPSRFLAEEILEAHWAINRYTSLRAIPLEGAPRTTCVACVIQGDLAVWAHTGDSRLYLIRDGHVRTRTVDHSRVQMLVDSGEITELEAQTHPQRNLVITCLGGEVPPRIDVSAVTRLAPGDTFALCSDGVWAPLQDALAGGLMYPLERAVPQLLDRAETLNGATSDNLSLIALRWESAGGKPQSDDRTVPENDDQTQVEDFAAATLPGNLSEAEIERQAAEIRAAIDGRLPT